MSLLDVLLKDSPNDAYPWLIRGRIWLLQSESRKAESDFRMALSIRPDWNEPLIYLAETLYDTRRASEALPLFENAMKSDEFRTRAAVGLARCMKAIAEVDKAKAVLQDALKQDPLNHDALMELGRTYQEEGEVNLAIPLLESAIRQMPGSEESHYRLAQCYLSVGRKDEADREFKIVDEARLALSELNRLNDQIRNQPQNEDLLVRSGELMLRFADPDDGVAVLMSALDINPSNKTAHKLLAEHYQKLSATIPELRQQFERHKKLSE
jgi:Tfp pilus assembly protein PilF